MKDILKLLAIIGLGAAAFYFRTGKKLQALKISVDKIANISISKGNLIVKFALKIANPNKKEGVTLQEINITVSDTSGNSANVNKTNINELIPAESVKPFNLTVNLGIAEILNVFTNLLDAFNQTDNIKESIPKVLNVSGYIVADKMKFPVNTTIETA